MPDGSGYASDLAIIRFITHKPSNFTHITTDDLTTFYNISTDNNWYVVGYPAGFGEQALQFLYEDQELGKFVGDEELYFFTDYFKIGLDPRYSVPTQGFSGSGVCGPTKAEEYKVFGNHLA